MENLARYLVLNDSGNKISFSDNEEELESLSYLCKNRQVIILIPGKYVSFHTVVLPPGTHDKLQASLPYILEDEISDNIDDLHFVLGPKILEQDSFNDDKKDNQEPKDDLDDLEIQAKELINANENIENIENIENSSDINKQQYTKSSLKNSFFNKKKESNYLVAVISKDIMEYYYNLLKTHGIKPDFLLPDNYCLANNFTNQIYVNGLDKLIYLISANYNSYVVDISNKDFFVKNFLQNNLSDNDVYYYREEKKLTIENINSETIVDSGIELFAIKWLTQSFKLNLLTGKFKIFKLQIKNKYLWKIALSLIIVIVLADFGINLSKYILINQQINDVNNQISQEWKRAFPKNLSMPLPQNNAEITTLISREIEKVDRQQLQNNFFSTLNTLGVILSQYSNIKLESINFVEDQMEIKLITPNIILLNNFEKAFKSKNKNIKRISLIEDKNSFVAGFMIKVG
tara:strand:- start:1604 stop:2983 length:1380 start_codon:yes stop_codon:yes gene_type:complete